LGELVVGEKKGGKGWGRKTKNGLNANGPTSDRVKGRRGHIGGKQSGGKPIEEPRK